MTPIIALGVLEVQNFPSCCCCLTTDNPSMHLRKYRKMENVTEMLFSFVSIVHRSSLSRFPEVVGPFFYLLNERNLIQTKKDI